MQKKTTKKNLGSVLAAVVHELLNARPYQNLSDLSEDTKSRAARLRLPYNAALVSEAIASVARTRPLVTAV